MLGFQHFLCYICKEYVEDLAKIPKSFLQVSVLSVSSNACHVPEGRWAEVPSATPPPQTPANPDFRFPTLLANTFERETLEIHFHPTLFATACL